MTRMFCRLRSKLLVIASGFLLTSIVIAIAVTIVIRARSNQRLARVRATGGYIAWKSSTRNSEALGTVFGDYREVAGVHFGPQSFDSDLEILQALRPMTVSVRGSNITDAGMTHIAKLKNLYQLTIAFTEVTHQGIGALEACESLNALDLAGDSIDDELVDQLDRVGCLRSLSLEQTNVSIDGLEGVSRLVHLNSLYLDGNRRITDQGLRHLGSLDGIWSLGICDMSVGDEGLVHLRGLSQLQELSLDGTEVSDGGLYEIAATHPEISSLSVNRTRVGDLGMAHIAKMSKLEILSIWHTRVTDAGLVKLGGLKHLRVLSVGPCVTQDGVSSLANLLPSCQIEFVNVKGERVLLVSPEGARYSAEHSVP